MRFDEKCCLYCNITQAICLAMRSILQWHLFLEARVLPTVKVIEYLRSRYPYEVK